jgi:hypothetical protein
MDIISNLMFFFTNVIQALMMWLKLLFCIKHELKTYRLSAYHTEIVCGTLMLSQALEASEGFVVDSSFTLPYLHQ